MRGRLSANGGRYIAAIAAAAQENIGDHRLRNMFSHAGEAKIVQAEFIVRGNIGSRFCLREEFHRPVAPDIEEIFLIGDAIKIALAAGIFPSAWWYVNNGRSAGPR